MRKKIDRPPGFSNRSRDVWEKTRRKKTNLGLGTAWPEKYRALQNRIQTTAGELDRLHSALEILLLAEKKKAKWHVSAGLTLGGASIAVDPKKISRHNALYEANKLDREILKWKKMAEKIGKSAIQIEREVRALNPSECPNEIIGRATYAWGRLAEISIETKAFLQQAMDVQHLLEVYGRTGIRELPLKPDHR